MRYKIKAYRVENRPYRLFSFTVSGGIPRGIYKSANITNNYPKYPKKQKGFIFLSVKGRLYSHSLK